SRVGGVNGSPTGALDDQLPTRCRGQTGRCGSVVPNDLVEVGAATREDGRAVIGGIAADAVNFRLDRGELGVQRLALGAVIDRPVGRLSGQGNRPVQQGGDL